MIIDSSNDGRSLIEVGVNSAGGLESVQAGVDKVAAIEGLGEGLGSGVEALGEVLLFWYCTSVLLVGGLVQQILFKGLFWVLDLLSICNWELLGDHILLLNLSHIVLNSSVDLSVKLSSLSHLSESLVLVGLQSFFHLDILLALIKNQSTVT